MLCFFYKAKPRTSDFSRPSAFAFVYLWISSLEAQSVLYRSNRKISAVFSSPSLAPLVQRERSNKLYSARLAIRQFVKKSWRGVGVNVYFLDAINFLFLWMKLQVLDIVGMYSGWAGIE